MSPCSHGADPLSSNCQAVTVLPTCSLTGSTVLSTGDSSVQYCGAVSTSRGGHWTVPGSPAPAVMADPISAPTTEESTVEAAVVEGGGRRRRRRHGRGDAGGGGCTGGQSHRSSVEAS